MRKYVGTALPTRKIEFLGKANALEIRKLSGREIKEFQEFAKNDASKLPEDQQGSAIQNYLLRVSVTDAADISDEEFLDFPLDELGKVAKAILVFAGAQLEDGTAPGPNA